MSCRAKTARRGRVWLWRLPGNRRPPPSSDRPRAGRIGMHSCSPMPGSGAILRDRGGCFERVKYGLSRVDVGVRFLKTVEERPSSGGEGLIEVVARIASPDLEDDGCSFDRLLVKMWRC